MTAAVIPSGLRRRRPEPPERQSHQPVRRNSRMDGGWTEGFFRRLDWADKHELLRAVRAYDRAKKQPGARQGPIGRIAIDLVEELATMAVIFHGRVRPTLAALQARLRISRDALVRAMRRLADIKVLEWVRRLVPAEGEWARGPRVAQTSNVYRLTLPKALRKYLRKPPASADLEARKAAMQADIDAAIRAEAAEAMDGAIARGRARAEARNRAASRAPSASPIDGPKPSRI